MTTTRTLRTLGLVVWEGPLRFLLLPLTLGTFLGIAHC